MTTEKIQSISRLHIQLSIITESNIYLRRALKQMATDHCTLTLSFDMHNFDQHDRNDAQFKKDQLLADPGLFGVTIRTKMPLCHHYGSGSYTESGAMRILSAILRENEKEEQRILNELSTIIENPIHSLQFSQA